jgi:hypothetical protein
MVITVLRIFTVDDNIFIMNSVIRKEPGEIYPGSKSPIH